MPRKSKEEKRAYEKLYYQINKEKIKLLSKESYERNKKNSSPEQIAKKKKRQQEYYLKVKDKNKKKWADTKSIWYQNNRNRILLDAKEWRIQNLGNLIYRFRRAKYAAKQRKILFSLTFDQFSEIVVLPCFYCDNKFCQPVIEGSGLDRLDNSKGYEFDNVVSCGYRCNILKLNDLTIEETKTAINAILELRNESKQNKKSD